MNLVEADRALCQIAKYETEHSLDCEEGGPKDRCVPCLALAALEGRLEEVFPSE